MTINPIPTTASSEPATTTRATTEPNDSNTKTKHKFTKQRHISNYYKSLPSNAKIGIIGGGISGLSTAISLQKHGYTNIHIFERDDKNCRRRDGYGLTIAYNDSPNSCLVQLGILQDLVDCNVLSKSHFVFRHDGVIMGYYGPNNTDAANADKQTKKSKVGNIRIQRPLLKKIMCDKLNANTTTIQYNKKLVSFECDYYDDDNNDSDSSSLQICVMFQDDTKEYFDLIVGADGIRSTTLSQYYTLLNTIQQQKQKQKQKQLSSKSNGILSKNIIQEEQPPPLSYLKIFLILGITSYKHSLLTQRGFYTLDGTSRLFTMPFDENHTMWQLSFRLEDEFDAKKLQNASATTKIEEALRRCNGWHAPVQEIIQCTSLEYIWGTALVDKIPKPLHPTINKKYAQAKIPFLPIIALGDAMHPMSPFKGQGANTALNDGVLLTDFLQKSSTLYKALSNFERVMNAKGKNKVLLSREAAHLLHSIHVLEKKKTSSCNNRSSSSSDFIGYKEKCFGNQELLDVLEKKGITADLGDKLDDSIAFAIRELFEDNNDDGVREDGESDLMPVLER